MADKTYLKILKDALDTGKFNLEISMKFSDNDKFRCRIPSSDFEKSVNALIELKKDYPEYEFGVETEGKVSGGGRSFMVKHHSRSTEFYITMRRKQNA